MKRLTYATANNVAPVAAYVTRQRKGVPSPLQICSVPSNFSRSCEPEAKEHAALSLTSMKPQIFTYQCPSRNPKREYFKYSVCLSELQSKTPNNNAGQSSTCFHGALICLVPQVMLHLFNTISVRRCWQTWGKSFILPGNVKWQYFTHANQTDLTKT